MRQLVVVLHIVVPAPLLTVLLRALPLDAPPPLDAPAGCVLSLVAARLSHLPWLVVVASPLVALPLPPNAMTCDGGSMCGCVCMSAEEGGG